MLTSKDCPDDAGWLRDVTAWIREKAAADGLGNVTSIERVRVSARAAILAVETTAGRLFFKASRFTQESRIHALLDSCHAGHVAPLVAVDVERGWMLVREVSADASVVGRDIERWAQVFRTLARIQRDFVSRVDELVRLGCRRCELPWLKAELDTALPQLLDHPCIANALDASELRAVRALAGCWQRMCAPQPLCVPCHSTLDHGDLHPDNVRMTASGPVYLDWEGAVIGHAFFTPHVLLGYVVGLSPQIRAAAPLLREAYLEPWQENGAVPGLRDVFASIQPLASLKYAFGVALANGLLPSPYALSGHGERKAAMTIAFCLRSSVASTRALERQIQ